MKKDKEWLKEEIRWLCHSKVLQSITINVDVLDNLIDQLEEPEQEKLVVPQFVADRIEEYREIRFGLSLIFTIDDQTEDDIDFSKWLSADIENCEKVARAWLDGYTVEKKPQWVVVSAHNWFFKRFEPVNFYPFNSIGTGSKDEAQKFTDESKAKAVALLVNGTAEEITK